MGLLPQNRVHHRQFSPPRQDIWKFRKRIKDSLKNLRLGSRFQGSHSQSVSITWPGCDGPKFDSRLSAEQDRVASGKKDFNRT